MRIFLDKLDRGFAALLEAVALLTSAAVTLLLLLLVVSRYLFNLSIGGLHELSLVAAMWLYMMGALIASRRREHIAIDYLAEKLTAPRARALHRLFIAAVTCFVAGCFVWWTWRMFAWGLQRPQTTPDLGIPLWLPQAAVAIASVGTVAYALCDLIAALRQLRQPQRGEA